MKGVIFPQPTLRKMVNSERLQTGMLERHLLQDLPGPISGTVIDHDYFQDRIILLE